MSRLSVQSPLPGTLDKQEEQEPPVDSVCHFCEHQIIMAASMLGINLPPPDDYVVCVDIWAGFLLGIEKL